MKKQKKKFEKKEEPNKGKWENKTYKNIWDSIIFAQPWWGIVVRNNEEEEQRKVEEYTILG